MLGGSCVVISGVISPLTWVITIVTLLTTPLITTHEPPTWWEPKALAAAYLSASKHGADDAPARHCFGFQVLGFWGSGVLGFRGLGFRGLGLQDLGFLRGLGV